MGALDWLINAFALRRQERDVGAEVAAAASDCDSDEEGRKAKEKLDSEISKWKEHLFAAGFTEDTIDNFIARGGATAAPELVDLFLAEHRRRADFTADISIAADTFGEGFQARDPYANVLGQMRVAINGGDVNALHRCIAEMGSVAIAVRVGRAIPWDELRRRQAVRSFIAGFGAFAGHKNPDVRVAFLADDPGALPADFLIGGIYRPPRSRGSQAS